MMIFLINLDRSLDRLAYMQDQLAGLSVANVQRVRAADGREGVPAHLKSQFVTSKLISAEVGCYASHLMAMEIIRDRGLPYAVVLEDDAVLDADFVSATCKAIAAADQSGEWHVIHLSAGAYRHRPRHVADIGVGDRERELVRFGKLPMTSTAYVVSAEGARRFLRPRPRVRPFDREFRSPWCIELIILGVKPALARQCARLGTTIGLQSNLRRRWGPTTFAEHMAKWRMKLRVA